MSSSGQQLQNFYLGRKGPPVLDIWNDGLICAFEFVPKSNHVPNSYWVPIGWERISELMKIAEDSVKRSSQQIPFIEDEVDFTASGVAARPIWWCHVFGGHSKINEWLKNAHWLDPSISTYLTNENTCFSDWMKHFGFEVPIRVERGILFELYGYSVSDPLSEEDDTPIVLRSYQTQQFLLTVMHVKGFPSKINVPAINEVQDIILTVGTSTLKSVHEVIAQLACHLSRWDDRLFHKFVFGAVIEIELKFMNWKTYEDPNLINIILNEDIKKLATKVVRVQWSLHARETIVFELLQHLRGTTTKSLLEVIKNTTREMLKEQETVRGRLFTIQEALQSTVRACLKDKSLRNTHYVRILGVCGLFVSIIVGIFRINLDGFPGAKDTPYFGLLFFGILLFYFNMRYFKLKKPDTEEQVNARNLEIQQLFFTFKRDVEAHARK